MITRRNLLTGAVGLALLPLAAKVIGKQVVPQSSLATWYDKAVITSEEWSAVDMSVRAVTHYSEFGSVQNVRFLMNQPKRQKRANGKTFYAQRNKRSKALRA